MSKLEYLKTIATPDLFKVTVKRCFDKQEDKFNPGHFNKNCIVSFNGKEYYLTVKEKDFAIADAGTELTLVRKEKNIEGKQQTWFELYGGGGDGTQPKQAETPKTNDYGTQVGRGASLNLAAYYSIYLASGGALEIAEWFDKVQWNASQLVEAQSKFVNS